MMAFTRKTTPKKPRRQRKTVRPVSGRGCFISSSCGSAEIVARRSPLARHRVVEVEGDRRGSRGIRYVVGHQHAHFARLIRPYIDYEAAVLARLHNVEQRAGQPGKAESELTPFVAL